MSTTQGFAVCVPVKHFMEKPALMLGDWSKDTVRLDFDDTALPIVKYWAFRANSWFHLGGFVILRSSVRTFRARVKGKEVCKYYVGNYHVVFDRPVRWVENLRIINWVALESGNEGLKRYAMMQAIKRTSTLRIGAKGRKSPPRIVFRHGSQDTQIAVYLDARNFLLHGIKNNWGD